MGGRAYARTGCANHVGGQGGEIIPNAAKAIICTVGAARGGEAIQNDNKSDHLDNLGGQGCEIFKNGTKSDHLVRLGGQATEIIMTDTKNYHSVTAGVRLDATGRPNFCTIPYTPNNCQCFCFRFLNKLCSAGVGRQCFLHWFLNSANRAQMALVSTRLDDPPRQATV